MASAYTNLSSAASLPFSSSTWSVLDSLELEHKMFMVVCVLKGAVRNDDVCSLLSVIKTWYSKSGSDVSMVVTCAFRTSCHALRRSKLYIKPSRCFSSFLIYNILTQIPKEHRRMFMVVRVLKTHCGSWCVFSSRCTCVVFPKVRKGSKSNT
jgi:hypothetical protein